MLFPHIAFDVGGEAVVLASFIAPDPFNGGKDSETRREIRLPQPKTWASDEDFLQHIQAQYPDCLVDWHSPAPETDTP